MGSSAGSCSRGSPWARACARAVELEASRLQAVAGARVAGVQDRHVVLLGQRVDRREQAREVGLGVYALLAVGRQQHIALGLKAELGEDVRGLDLVNVRVQDLGHGRAGDEGALRAQPVSLR